MSTLADRIRGIVGTPSPEPRVPSSEPQGPSPEPRDLRALGGEWRQTAHGSCFIVERRIDPRAQCGHTPVGELAAQLQDGAADAPIVAGGAPARPPFVFLDLETTGLSGGAGTFAFLVGCAWFDEDDGFVTRQYVMTRFADERPLLGAVAGELARAGALVSFNGKSFDAPVLETRYLFHRLEWVGARLAHVDVLHPARRFWGQPFIERTFQARLDRGPERAALQSSRERRASLSAERSSPCSLSALEQQVLGARREGDVPGHEIPARYFQFVRSGDARPLAAVLEHNRLDLLSLAGLAARLLRLVRTGPAAARDAREALALGRVYWRAGLEARACEAYACAASASMAGSAASIRADALRALALASRRTRRYEDAAGFWRQVLEVGECPRHIAREATEALAIHHEHRVHDLAAARTFALRSLENGPHPAWTGAVQHRLARIERKMGGGTLPLA